MLQRISASLLMLAGILGITISCGGPVKQQANDQPSGVVKTAGQVPTSASATNVTPIESDPVKRPRAEHGIPVASAAEATALRKDRSPADSQIEQVVTSGIRASLQQSISQK